MVVPGNTSFAIQAQQELIIIYLIIEKLRLL